MVDVYNALPRSVVDSPSVNAFQSSLMYIVRTRCQMQDVVWASSFSRRALTETS